MSEQNVTPETHIDEVSYIPKMNIKSIECDPKMVFGKPPEDKTPLPLARIFGVATDTKTDEDKRTGNVWTALVGDFEGINLISGKRFKSAMLFLPSGIQEVIEGPVVEIAHLRDAGEKVDSMRVEFALEIASIRATNAAGYSYQARNLQPVKRIDNLSGLRAFALNGLSEETVKKLNLPSVPVPQLPPPVETQPAPNPQQPLPAAPNPQGQQAGAAAQRRGQSTTK